MAKLAKYDTKFIYIFISFKCQNLVEEIVLDLLTKVSRYFNKY